MSTKHIFQSAEGLVLKSLRGAVAANPALGLHSASKSTYIIPQSRSLEVQPATVAVISGGGAGHEPAYAGYTGRGMLAASVSGDIFASPNAKQILHTICLASSSGQVASLPLNQTYDVTGHKLKDVLVIINNYTGDRLNFGLAIEKALASTPIEIESVVVADDVSLLRSKSTSSLVGARGLAGNILVCKILGAFAERGEPLARVKQLGDAIVQNLASVGIGLEHCHVPGRAPWGSGTHEGLMMGQDECEIGLGLHNEPGVTRQKIENAEEVIKEMLGLIMHSRDDDREEFIKRGLFGAIDEVILFVNNLGGMSQLEMGAILDEIVTQLDGLFIYPVRIYISSFMTSLNAPGFSISLLNISRVQRALGVLGFEGNSTFDLASLTDDPTEALAWTGVRSHWRSRGQARQAEHESEEVPPPQAEPPQDFARMWNFTVTSPESIKAGIKSACNAVLKVEKLLTDFDTILGDGDCGETFSAGAKAILASVERGKLDAETSTPGEFVHRLSELIEDAMGGTIGALFAIFLTALSTNLSNQSGSPAIDWAGPLQAAMTALGKYTPAKIGDRTIVDALDPFCATLSSGKSFKEAVSAARAGAERTRGMQAVLGRAAYVNHSMREGDELPPDPGAWGIAAILEGLSQGLSTAAM